MFKIKIHAAGIVKTIVKLITRLFSTLQRLDFFFCKMPRVCDYCFSISIEFLTKRFFGSKKDFNVVDLRNILTYARELGCLQTEQSRTMWYTKFYEGIYYLQCMWTWFHHTKSVRKPRSFVYFLISIFVVLHSYK